MRNLVLNPRQALYTEDLTDSETIAGALEISTELRNGGTIRTPVYVIKFPEFRNLFAIFNGNRRTRACEMNGLSVTALEIQSPQDFQLAQADQPANWHKLEEEDFLKFNGDYFYKDMASLKREGLLVPAYHRAKKRIKDAVKRFYHWL